MTMFETFLYIPCLFKHNLCHVLSHLLGPFPAGKTFLAAAVTTFLEAVLGRAHYPKFAGVT